MHVASEPGSAVVFSSFSFPFLFAISKSRGMGSAFQLDSAARSRM